MSDLKRPRTHIDTKMKEKNIILTARVISLVFTPFYLSIVGLMALFTFSYLSLLPWNFKLITLALVYIFTILVPTLIIHLYRRSLKNTPSQSANKERRAVPYIISIVSYFVCCYLMGLLHMPHFMISILLAALVIQIVCALVNVWWKISTHTAAIGGVAGALMAFAAIFMFNPVWWLCVVFILAGMVGTSRMILRQHSLSQVVAGFLIGWSTSYSVVMTI